MKIFLTFLFLLTFPAMLFSQDVSEKQEYIQSMKVSFLTKRLNLKPAEAQLFWPIYNQYQDELETLRKNHRKEMEALNEAFTGMNEKDIEKMVDSEIIFKEKEIEILKKYHPQFKKALPIRKVALLYKAEEDFKRYLIKQIKSGNL